MVVACAVILCHYCGETAGLVDASHRKRSHYTSKAAAPDVRAADVVASRLEHECLSGVVVRHDDGPERWCWRSVGHGDEDGFLDGGLRCWLVFCVLTSCLLGGEVALDAGCRRPVGAALLVGWLLHLSRSVPCQLLP